MSSLYIRVGKSEKEVIHNAPLWGVFLGYFMTSYLTQQGNRLVLSVRVSPNAKRSGIEGVWNDTHLKIALSAPPVDGKANEALVDFLSDLCGLRKSAITLLSGQTGRIKKISLTFASEVDAQKAGIIFEKGLL